MTNGEATDMDLQNCMITSHKIYRQGAKFQA